MALYAPSYPGNFMAKFQTTEVKLLFVYLPWNFPDEGASDQG